MSGKYIINIFKQYSNTLLLSYFQQNQIQIGNFNTWPKHSLFTTLWILWIPKLGLDPGLFRHFIRKLRSSRSFSLSDKSWRFSICWRLGIAPRLELYLLVSKILNKLLPNLSLSLKATSFQQSKTFQQAFKNLLNIRGPNFLKKAQALKFEVGFWVTGWNTK